MSEATPQQLLDLVCRAAERLMSAAEPYHGLMPSLLDRHSGAMLRDLPAPIDGQRNADRAHLGSNLIHDQVTLKTMLALARVRDRPDYAEAADAYLRRFAKHCTNTATGLFPWGEHSFWHLVDDRVGNSYVYHRPDYPATPTHDHLRQVPLWVWEKLLGFHPACVERFAEGLDFHWTEGERPEYMRHAPIEERRHPEPAPRACDFPRHSGFYLFDWVVAWRRFRRQDFLRQIDAMLDYWWEKRDARGLLLIESRAPAEMERFHGINAPGQTLSLAAGLLECAELLEGIDAGRTATLRERAAVYIDGFFAAPHDMERGEYVFLSRCDDNSATQTMPVWGSKYGCRPAAYVAGVCLAVHRLTGDGRPLAWAEAVGRDVMTHPFPSRGAVPAMDAGLALAVLADLYEITGERRWRDGGLRLADTLSAVYLDAPLPRGAAGIDWYEAQLGTGFLLFGLARVALLAIDRTACPLTPDSTAR